MQERAGIGSTVVIKGELTAHEDVVISGRIEGSITVTAHRVIVEVGAHVVGDVRASEIAVGGTVEGSLKAEERVVVHAGADVQGDVSAPRVGITEGGLVNGRIDTRAAGAAALKAAS